MKQSKQIKKKHYDQVKKKLQKWSVEKLKLKKKKKRKNQNK